MGIFDKFSLHGFQSKPKTYELPEVKCSPIIGQASTYKTLAMFDIKVDTPKYVGDIPNAVIKSYQDFK